MLKCRQTKGTRTTNNKLVQQQQNTLEVLYVIIYNFFQLIICKFLLSNVGIFLFSRPIKTVSPIKIQQFIDYLANPIQTNLAWYFLKSARHYPNHAQHRARYLTERGSDSHLCISIQHYRKPTVVALELEVLYVISVRAINETFFQPEVWHRCEWRVHFGTCPKYGFQDIAGKNLLPFGQNQSSSWPWKILLKFRACSWAIYKWRVKGSIAQNFKSNSIEFTMPT